MRLFVAVELPHGIRHALGLLADRLLGDVSDARLVRPEGIHLTLRFLGETEETTMRGLSRELAARVPGTVGPFQVRVGGTGVFPEKGPPRVVWVGLHEATGALSSLHDCVEQAARASGFPAEDRRFRPHLTLARFGDGRAHHELRRVLEGSSSVEVDVFPVSSVCLIRSILKPGGAEYQRLEEYML